MRGERKQRAVPHSISGVFVFLLLGIFALSGTAMVLLGVQAYRRTAQRSGVHHTARIASSYLRSMVRAEDAAGTVRVEELDGLPVVTLAESYDGEEYAIRLYVWDGSLRESFAAAAEPFEPASGEAVCEAEEMTAALEDGLLRVRLRTGGEWQEVDITLYAAG